MSERTGVTADETVREPDSTLSGLAGLLRLAPDGEGVWTGDTHGVRLPHVFGGQLVAQSVVAAGRASAADMPVHSVHTTFLRAGDPAAPVSFHVRPLRSGRLVSTVEVEGRQGERLLCHSVVSCTRQAGGLSHARAPLPSAGPEDSADLRDLAAGFGGLGEFWEDFSAIEIRLAPDDATLVTPHSASAPNRVWMRVADELPDDDVVHRAALAYASDLMLMSTAVTPHGHVPGDESGLAERWTAVSLDHVIWFRRPVRAGEWLLFEHTTPMAGDSRVLIEAAVFDTGGDLVAQVAQEALIRPIDGEIDGDAHPDPGVLR